MPPEEIKEKHKGQAIPPPVKPFSGPINDNFKHESDSILHSPEYVTYVDPYEEPFYKKVLSWFR